MSTCVFVCGGGENERGIERRARTRERCARLAAASSPRGAATDRAPLLKSARSASHTHHTTHDYINALSQPSTRPRSLHPQPRPKQTARAIVVFSLAHPIAPVAPLLPPAQSDQPARPSAPAQQSAALPLPATHSAREGLERE